MCSIINIEKGMVILWAHLVQFWKASADVYTHAHTTYIAYLQIDGSEQDGKLQLSLIAASFIFSSHQRSNAF